MMRVYLAAQYNQKHYIATKKRDLEALGFVVTSTWVDEPDNPNVSLKDVTPETLREYAARDISEIDDANLIVLFTVDPDEKTRRGGRHVEYGYAVGRGIPTCIIGPRENIFHHLLADDLCFPDWQSFIEGIQKMAIAMSEGTKHDGGKLRFDLLPAEELQELAKVYTIGAAKYDDRNWEQGISWGRIFAAIMRHLWAFWCGEEIDPEDGISHPIHAAWGCLTLSHYMKHHRGLDNRSKFAKDAIGTAQVQR